MLFGDGDDSHFRKVEYTNKSDNEEKADGQEKDLTDSLWLNSAAGGIQ